MVEQIKKLCAEHKTNIKALEKELGFGNGTIRRWDKNAPSIERIKLVSNRFNVPISYLLGWDEAVSNLNAVGMSELDVAQEMGIDPAVLNSYLSSNDASSATAVSKFVRVASLLSDQKEKSPAPEGAELDAETIQLREIWDGADKEEREALLAMAKMLKARRNK